MFRNIDITPEQFTIVQSILKKQLSKNARAWVFGSRAKQTAKKSSDLDLALDQQGVPLTLAAEGTIKETFDNSILPFKVDIVDWNAITDSFRKAIQDDCIEILF